MELRVTILCENSVIVPFSVIGEHGFSAFVETPSGNFLFDTGQGKGLLNNSMVLKKDLKSVKWLYISHGHYDHTLGIPMLLLEKSPIDVYAHPDIFVDRFWIKEGTPPKFIGIPYKESYLKSLGANFKYIKDFTEIERGIYSSGEVPMVTDFENIDANMKVLRDGSFYQDKLNDDFSMAIDTSKGLVIILGCAHAGIINIINHFIQKTGKDKIYAVLGGTHLGFADPKQMNATLEIIKNYKIEKVGASHCTGLANSATLFNHLKDKFFFASVGQVLEV